MGCMSPRSCQPASGAASARPISSSTRCGGASICTCSARQSAVRTALLSGEASTSRRAYGAGRSGTREPRIQRVSSDAQAARRMVAVPAAAGARGVAMFHHHGAPTDKEQRLAALTLFQDLPRRDLERIAGLCTMVERPAGTVLCSEGRAGQECFVIVDGEVAVTISGSEVATLGAGSVFGELAVLDGEPRTATARAASLVRLAVFSRREFEDLLECEPRVARRILDTVGARLRRTDRRLPVVDLPVDAIVDA